MTNSLPPLNRALNQPHDAGAISIEPNVGVLSKTTPTASNTNESAAMRRFLKETGGSSLGELAMSLEEMRPFVPGHLIRHMRRLPFLISSNNQVNILLI